MQLGQPKNVVKVANPCVFTVIQSNKYLIVISAIKSFSLYIFSVEDFQHTTIYNFPGLFVLYP